MTTPIPYTPQQVLNNLRNFITELLNHPYTRHDCDALSGPGYVLRQCQNIIDRGIKEPAGFTLQQRVTITKDVHWTDDNNQERITLAPCTGTITAIDPRPDVTIYEIILDNDAGWFLHEPTADGPIVIPTTTP